jgi:hypothetical protein
LTEFIQYGIVPIYSFVGQATFWSQFLAIWY